MCFVVFEGGGEVACECGVVVTGGWLPVLHTPSSFPSSLIRERHKPEGERGERGS